MKLAIRFDPFDLDEVLFEKAVESMPPDASGTDEQALIPAREARYRELLAPWIDSSGQDSGRIVVEFDLGADPPTARVLRRDGKEEIGEMLLFTAVQSAKIRRKVAAAHKKVESGFTRSDFVPRAKLEAAFGGVPSGAYSGEDATVDEPEGGAA